MKPLGPRTTGLLRLAHVLLAWGLLTYGCWRLWPPSWPLVLGGLVWADLYLDRWFGRADE